MDDSTRRRETPDERITRMALKYGVQLLDAVAMWGVREGDAPDAVQETLFRAWTALRRGTEVGHDPVEEQRWLFRIAFNIVMSGHRSRSREQRHVRQRAEQGRWPTESHRKLSKTGWWPLVRKRELCPLEWAECEKAFWEAVNELRPEYRKVILECLLRGIPVAEWAREQEISQRTAANWKANAIRDLRRKLEVPR